jgi:TonB family protein
MSHESGQRSRDYLGVLKRCLVEGDPEQLMLQRKMRRRALVLSVAFESVVVSAILLVPLFGKPPRIALASVTPLPLYDSRPAPRAASDARPETNAPKKSCRFCPGWKISHSIVRRDPPRPDGGPGELIVDGFPNVAEPLLDIRTTPGPRPPDTHVDVPRVRLAHISPAMITHRVEPVFPTLARQIGRSGRVELRAIIAADGSIQSLEAVGGDPMFYQSALDAVRQWRYTPTLLNGQQVQVDTYITVIYNAQR